MDKLTI
jgi:hypothetical protein